MAVNRSIRLYRRLVIAVFHQGSTTCKSGLLRKLSCTRENQTICGRRVYSSKCVKVATRHNTHVAQLVEAPDLGSGQCKFESHLFRHTFQRGIIAIVFSFKTMSAYRV